MAEKAALAVGYGLKTIIAVVAVMLVLSFLAISGIVSNSERQAVKYEAEKAALEGQVSALEQQLSSCQATGSCSGRDAQNSNLTAQLSSCNSDKAALTAQLASCNATATPPNATASPTPAISGPDFVGRDITLSAGQTFTGDNGDFTLTFNARAASGLVEFRVGTSVFQRSVGSLTTITYKGRTYQVNLKSATSNSATFQVFNQ